MPVAQIAASAASGVLKALIPSNTSTTNNGTTDTSSSSTADVIAGSTSNTDTYNTNYSDVSSNTNTTQTNTTASSTGSSGQTSDTTGVTNYATTDTSGFTQNSADPGVIATLKNLAQTAISNATDPNKTTGLISNIIQQAGDAMTSIYGQQNEAGLYDSAATTDQTNDILSRAAADVAPSILSYQSGQEQLADTALSQLLTATSNQTTGTTSASNSGSTTVNNSSWQNLSNTLTTAIQNLVSNSSTLSTAVQTGGTSTETGAESIQTANTSSTSATKGASTSSTSATIICTWMLKNNRLQKKRYQTVSALFQKKPLYYRRAYQITFGLLLKELQRNNKSLISRWGIKLFDARTEYVCAKQGLSGCKATFLGWAASWFIVAVCILPGICWLLHHWFNQLFGAKQETTNA